MKPYSIQNILVPIDLSESSSNVLDTAVALSKKHNAAIYFLHVTEAAHAKAESQKITTSQDLQVLMFCERSQVPCSTKMRSIRW